MAHDSDKIKKVPQAPFLLANFIFCLIKHRQQHETGDDGDHDKPLFLGR